MDRAVIEGGGINTPLHAIVAKFGSELPWDVMIKEVDSIKDRLFANTRESYLLNLRAKHEELLLLLDELSEKNRELDQANNELLRLSRDLEVMAHERTVTELALRVADNIRNPATVIGGLAHGALQKLPEDFPQRKKLEAIFAEARKLEKIVRDFDELARNTGRMFVRKDLRETVNEIIDGCLTLFERKSVDLKREISDQPVMAIVETNTLKVALRHVLKNALDASPEHGTVTVSAGVWEGEPRIVVSDQGPGFSQEVLEQLFKNTVSTKQAGTGMGLITVKQIMDEHQGDIRIVNNPGGGASVSLVFPPHWKQLPRSGG
jgi:two-component system, sporulation sensor kinase E